MFLTPDIIVRNEIHPYLRPKLERALSIGAAIPSYKHIANESATIDRIVKALGGFSTQIGTLRFMCGDGSKEFALIDLIHPTTYVPSFSGTFTQSYQGIKVDNTSYIDTGVSPNQLNSDGHISESVQNIFLHTTMQSIQVGTTTDYGCTNTTPSAISWRLATKPSSAVCVAGQRNPAAGSTPAASPATYGWYYGYHDGVATANKSYMNGTLTSNHTGDAGFASGFSRNLFLGAANFNGSAAQYAEGRYAVCGVGAGGGMNALMATTIKQIFDDYVSNAA
jgi:hypothetical protein